MTANDDNAAAAWRAWRDRREAKLLEPEGWLALTGLSWLSEGENRIEGLPGVFVLQAGRVTLRAQPADGYLIDGAPLTERALRSDASDRTERLSLGTRALQVIERGGAIAVRAWDSAAPARSAFRGIETFPFDPRWRIEARWEAYGSPRQVEQPSAAGPPQKALAPGRAHFTVDGRELMLEPTLEASTGSGSGGAASRGQGRSSLMFVFKDATAPAETYGAGRFLGAALPADAKVLLDFNRACNPPCAFTPYATCPLADRQNVLPVRIEAGEKVYRREH
jgi:uncharacterized protein (DUF1684 family)